MEETALVTSTASSLLQENCCNKQHKNGVWTSVFVVLICVLGCQVRCSTGNGMDTPNALFLVGPHFKCPFIVVLISILHVFLVWMTCSLQDHINNLLNGI